MIKIIFATVFLFTANVLAESKASTYKLSIDRIIENYNKNSNLDQAVAFTLVVGTKADAKLMREVLKSSKSNSLIKAEKIDDKSVKIGETLLKFEQDKIFVNGYEVNFVGKKSLVDRIEYLQRIMKFNEIKKKTKTSWIELLIPYAQAADESENREFARRMAASASSMWNWWLYDRYEYGNPEQFQSFQALIAIPDKIDLEVDCKASPASDESFKRVVNYNPASYLGRQNVFGDVKSNFPLKLTYTKANGEKVIMWVTEAGTAGVSMMDGLSAPRHVNVVKEDGSIEAFEITKPDIKKEYEFKNDTSNASIARALVKCCEKAESGKASCLSSFKAKLDKQFQTNKEGQRTIRETTRGVSGVSN